jgi:hypothetical protein
VLRLSALPALPPVVARRFMKPAPRNAAYPNGSNEPFDSPL